jgi:hypothetical protein
VYNKTLLFFGGLFLGNLIADIFLMSFDKLFPEGLLIRVEAVFLQYALALLLMKWRGIPWPVDLTEAQLQRKALRERIQDLMKDSTEATVVLPAVRQSFPDMALSDIVEEYKRSTGPAALGTYRIMNGILIICLLISAAYTIVQRGDSNLHFYHGDWLDNMTSFIIFLLVASFTILKIRLAGDLFHFKAYAYRLTALLGVFGVLSSLFSVFQSSNGLEVFDLLANVLFVGIAVSAARGLYPHYVMLSGDSDASFELERAAEGSGDK